MTIKKFIATAICLGALTSFIVFMIALFIKFPLLLVGTIGLLLICAILVWAIETAWPLYNDN
jgi:hypothetical protein